MSIYDIYPEQHEFDAKLDIKKALLSILTSDATFKNRLTRIRTLWVIKQRFWHNRSYRDIGRELGLSQERVRQIEAKGLRFLKHPMHGLRFG